MTLKKPVLCHATLLAGLIVLLWLQPLMTLRLQHNDAWMHLNWADQFYTALREGQLLPRWAYACLDGLGDPSFVYYQPLFYYIDSIFLSLGFVPQFAILLTAISGHILLAIGTYHLLGSACSPRWTLAGTTMVVASPSLLFVPFAFGFFPWTLGIPLSALFVVESVRIRPRPTALALLLCLTTLAHLLSGLMALCCAGLARLIISGVNRHTLRANLGWGIGIATGLGLAAFFVYPAVTQLHLINPDGWTTGKTFDWRSAMFFPTFTFVLFGSRWMAFQWYLPIIVLGMAVTVLLGERRLCAAAPDDLSNRLAIAAMVALALGSEFAFPLYVLVPAMQKLQFPFRFLPLAAILAGIALVLHLGRHGWRHWAAGGRALIVVLVALYGAQSIFVQWNLYLHGELLPERKQYLNGRFGQVEYLLAARGPNWETYIKNGKLTGECRRLGIRCDEPPTQLSHGFQATVTTAQAVTLRLPVFAYPAWGVSIDGKPYPLVLDPDTGLIQVSVQNGRHVVRLHWAGLPAEHLGRRITFAALAVLALLAIAGRMRKRKVLQADASPANATKDWGKETELSDIST